MTRTVQLHGYSSMFMFMSKAQWRIQSWSQGGGGGGFPSHTFKGLVKVSASYSVIRVDLKKIMAGGGGFPGNQKKTLDTPLKPT